jgi:hypothetical protein
MARPEMLISITLTVGELDAVLDAMMEMADDVNMDPDEWWSEERIASFQSAHTKLARAYRAK